MKIRLLILMLGLCMGAVAEDWHSIAVDDLGKKGAQPYLTRGAGNYRFNMPELSDELATVAYGNVVELTYKNIDPVALYRLKLQFVCDAGTRTQSVEVNGVVLQKSFQLKKGAPTEVVLEISNEVASSGILKVQVLKQSGDNAVLSHAELFSTEKQDVARDERAVQILENIEIPVPRLSPIPSEVAGVEKNRLELDGSWRFSVSPDAGFENKTSLPSWADIQVPGEWAMQGFNVETNRVAGYFRTFTVPEDWAGKRIKLRFDAVYSDATVFVNGTEAGAHLGGFTPFELDVTPLVKLGAENTLALKVINESVADSLASGSKYACHPLGGIPRSAHLMVLPDVNIGSLAVQTSFDDAFKDAELKVLVSLSNESDAAVSGLKLEYKLAPWRGDGRVKLDPDPIAIESIDAGQTVETVFTAPVVSPEKWDCENPNLYVLECVLSQNGTVLQTVEQRFGFRTSEVIGNQLFINGQPVKLRGVNRHEVYPLTGRSIPKELYRRDVELFRAGNVNHIRTSHYPPDRALMEAADELGMLIECEGPFCWAHRTKADPQAIREATVRQNLEMVEYYRNHPSIVFWSIANESHWNAHFDASGKAMAQLDPTRPITFNYFPWGWDKADHTKDRHICSVGSDHYPGYGGAEQFADYERPISYGEFAHLNAYNRYELATDVALRDKWGIYLFQIWEGMVASKGVLGGSIWAGIDDTFYWDFKNEDGSIEERTVGYGTWGPIDGWRRKKPEWWGMKKTFSPIRIKKDRIVFQGSELIVPLENRQDFSNLNRLKISWKLGEESGTAIADIAPRSHGELVIKTQGKISAAEKLELVVDDPRGFNVDSFMLPLGTMINEVSAAQPSESYVLKEIGDKIEIKGRRSSYNINRQTGLFESPDFTGPYLMILPLNKGGDTQMHGPTKKYEPYTHTCKEWNVDTVESGTENGLPIVVVKGSYKEAAGSFTYRFNTDSTFTIEYDFQTLEKVNPRQLGIVFKLPRDREILSWKRNGFWTTYPEWHIARLEGTATASEGVEATQVGPRKKPSYEWRHDRTKIGSHDFASTKHNIYSASLLNKSGEGMEVVADADRHVRAWIEDDRIRLLIAHYSNGGNERFLRRLSKKDDRPLEKGGRVFGSAILQLK